MGKKDFKLPKRIVLPPNISKSKIKYLELGFQRLEIPVLYSRKLTSEIKDGVIYPINLIYGKDRERRVWFDIVADRYKRHPELMGPDDYYFKTHMNLEDEGQFERFFPMPQSTANTKMVKYLAELRRFRRRRKPKYDIMGAFVNSDAGLRQRVIEKVRAGGEIWNGAAWMIVHPRLPRPPVPDKLIGAKLPYLEHLKMQAVSRLCLALPGARKNKGASISFRHIEIWALGGVVLTIPPGTVQVGAPEGCTVEFKEDLSDFEDVVNAALEDPERMAKIGAKGAKQFDTYHTPQAHAKHIIRSIWTEETKIKPKESE